MNTDYTLQDQHNLCVLLKTTKGIGPNKFLQIINLVSSTSELKAKINDLNFLNPEIKSDLQKNLASNEHLLHIANCKAQGIKIITYFSKKYPEHLKKVASPPILLYAKGNTDLLANNFTRIAVVGSRKYTEYGDMATKKIVSGLAGSTGVVVSGMALGIDAIAHTAAIDNNIFTIAILGNGINCAYPKENAHLYTQILHNNGLILSEYPDSLEPKPGLFIARNRIVAGICSATLVCEAEEESGSLTTANLTQKYNRPVFAVPGSIFAPSSTGTNGLIKNGAHLITCTQDILNKLNLEPQKLKVSKSILNNLPPHEANLVSFINKTQDCTLDKITLGLKISTNIVLQQITILEVKGYVAKNKSGSYYVKA